MLNNRFLSWVLSGALGLLASFLVFFFIVCAIKSTQYGTGQVDYCYIEREWSGDISRQPIYKLRGHVPWSNDKVIFLDSNFDVVVAAAKKIDCPLNGK